MAYFILFMCCGLKLFTACSLASDSEVTAQELYNSSLEQLDKGKEEAQKLLNSIDPKLIKVADDSYLDRKNDSGKGELEKKDPNSSCAEKICKAKVINFQQPIQQNEISTLLVFVTLSMTDEALRSLSREVEKAGGRLIIRGLVDDSFQKTQKRLLDLKINVDIDPSLFEQFDIREVPTFVHVKVENEDYGKTYDLLRGNVSLTYALEQFTEHGNIVSQHLLNKLRSSS